MTNQATPPSSSGVDIKLLTQFIREFNILRRNFASYPEGHPVVAGCLDKVVAVYRSLMQVSGSISLAVTKECLIMGTVVLEKGEPSYREFARSFFYQGIAAVTLHPGLGIEELKRILHILRMKREQYAPLGGIGKVWGDASVTSISIRPMLYEGFTFTEDGTVGTSAEGLWERLVHGLTGNKLDPAGSGDIAPDLDPEVIAEIFAEQGHDFSLVPAQIMDFLIHADSVSSQGGNASPLYQKVAAFVSGLNPELRQQFLSSAFTCCRPDGTYPAADIIASLPQDEVISLLDDANNSRITIPPVLLDLVHNLASDPSRRHTQVAPPRLVDHHKLAALFSEHAWEQFTPSGHQRNLSSMLKTDEITSPATELSTLVDTMQTAKVEHRVGEIILQMASRGGDADDLELLAQSMEEMCEYLVQTGEYGQVLILLRKIADRRYPAPFRNRIASGIARRHFLDEILGGLTTWGKSRFDDISGLIAAIGSPFVEPLLDRLAVEESLSLRRFIIGRLVSLGSYSRGPILARLNDQRWYFVRNLLTVLRSLEDPTLVPHIRPLLKHPNDAIAKEALRTLQQLGDPIVDKRILLDMESGNRDAQLAGIQVAGKSRSSEVFHALLGLACRGGLSPEEVDLRCSAVRALAEMARPEALAELSRILASSSLLRGKALNRLKREIVRSLAHYPANAAAPLLAPLASQRDEVGVLAAETLRTLKVKTNEQ